MRPRTCVLTLLFTNAFALTNCFSIHSLAQNGRAKSPAAKTEVSDSIPLYPVSEMRGATERYTVDRGTLARSYTVNYSTNRRERFRKFYSDWLGTPQKHDFASMRQVSII